MCEQQSLRSACAYAQSDQSLCLSLEYSMTVKLLAEHQFEILHLKGGSTGSSESTQVKMPHCWKSHVIAHLSWLVASITILCMALILLVFSQCLLSLPLSIKVFLLTCCSVVVDLLFIVTPIVGVCDRSMFCWTLLYVPSSFAIILMGKRELAA